MPKTEDGCLFCSIRDASESAAMVDEGPDYVAFLDSHPLFHGHVLVIPRDHYRTIFDLPVDQTAPLFTAVQRISVAVKSAMESDGVFIASNNGVSQSVDHLHVHVVPRNRKDGLRGFMWPRRKYETEDESEEIAAKIKAAL